MMQQQQKEQENIVMQHANLFKDNKDFRSKQKPPQRHKIRIIPSNTHQDSCTTARKNKKMMHPYS